MFMLKSTILPALSGSLMIISRDRRPSALTEWC